MDAAGTGGCRRPTGPTCHGGRADPTGGAAEVHVRRWWRGGSGWKGRRRGGGACAVAAGLRQAFCTGEGRRRRRGGGSCHGTRQVVRRRHTTASKTDVPRDAVDARAAGRVADAAAAVGYYRGRLARRTQKRLRGVQLRHIFGCADVQSGAVPLQHGVFSWSAVASFFFALSFSFRFVVLMVFRLVFFFSSSSFLLNTLFDLLGSSSFVLKYAHTHTYKNG